MSGSQNNCILLFEIYLCPAAKMARICWTAVKRPGMVWRVCDSTMAENENQMSVSLPEALRRQFVELERRLWTLETTLAVCWAAGGLILSYLVLFVSDRFWETPVWLRVLITLLGLGILAGTGLWWGRTWVWLRRDFRELSKLVQQKYRRLGDRLLGIVELANEKQRPAHFSPALYRAAIQQVATDALQFKFSEAVSLRPAKVHGLLLACLLMLLLMPVLLVPAAGWNAFLRWIAPGADIARYTLVNLEGLAAEQIVPHGEPFEVVGAVQYRSFWKPTRAKSQYERQPAIAATVQSNQVRFTIPGQVQRGVLKVRVGDVKREVTIIPTHRPSLRELAASIALPDYLRYPAIEQKIENGSLTVLEGSRVAFQGRTSRALSTANVRIEGGSSQNLKVRGEGFSSESLALDGIFQCGFTWADQFGLDNVVPWRLTIQTQKDLPPVPELPDISREIAILETEVLELKTVATDDFGVRELGLNWKLLSDWQTTNSSPTRTYKFETNSSEQKKLEQRFRFNAAMLGVPTDSSVDLRAYAKDFYPNREPSESPVYRIHVLGNERHAELVRQQLESVLARLEEVTRLEEKVTASTRELKELSNEKMSTEEAGERVSEARAEQSQNAASLEQLAKEGMKTLREALRNPTMPAQTLQDWAKNVQEMQELSQGKMQEAAKSLKAAQQNAKSRPEELAKALEKEEEALQDLERLQKKVNQALDDLQALTLAQRLRKIGSEEKEIQTQLQKNVRETIGLLAKDLSAKHREANAHLSTDQRQSQAESQILQGEISRFFERTQKKNYGEVSREMTEAKPGEELDKVRGLIEENISMEAMRHLADWSERFQKWAEKLEPKPDSSGGGGGGGEGNASDLANKLMKELLDLLRLREGEMNVRERTQLLENQKASEPKYADSAKALSSSQRNLLKKLVEIQTENPLPGLVEPLKAIFEPMHQAESLLYKPQTGEATAKAQTDAIALTSDVINLINEQAQQSSSSKSPSSSSQEMAFLMQMMAPENGQSAGMNVGRNPGRSTSGGTTDRPANPLEGDARGKGGEGRNVNKASGVTGNSPVEFRDALEMYFNAIEKEGD